MNNDGVCLCVCVYLKKKKNGESKLKWTDQFLEMIVYTIN
jgi:hypothetical protein